jgi:hypothetical protein
MQAGLFAPDGQPTVLAAAFGCVRGESFPLLLSLILRAC